jgi:large subunit ribosomal protein L28
MSPCVKSKKRVTPEGVPTPEKQGMLMSKVCTVCGKKPGYGNNRSHSNRATRRRFNPNLQKIRIVQSGSPTRAYVCAKCISAGKVQKVITGKTPEAV